MSKIGDPKLRKMPPLPNLSDKTIRMKSREKFRKSVVRHYTKYPEQFYKPVVDTTDLESSYYNTFNKVQTKLMDRYKERMHLRLSSHNPTTTTVDTSNILNLNPS